MLRPRSCNERIRLVAMLLALGGVAGCGGSTSASPPTAAPTSPSVSASATPADPCAATTAPARQPSLILCLTGAVDGQALVPDRDTTTCTGTGGTFSATFVTLVNSIETRLQLDGAGPTVTVIQAARARSWSSLAATRSVGRISIAADRSGSLDVTLPPRDLSSGGPGTGPSLHVRGTFRCPPG